MRIFLSRIAGLAIMSMLPGIALGQAKPECDPHGKMKTPEKIEAQIVKVNLGEGRLTVRESNGTVHEFRASKETLQELKVGDPIKAKLTEAPKCP